MRSDSEGYVTDSEDAEDIPFLSSRQDAPLPALILRAGGRDVFVLEYSEDLKRQLKEAKEKKEQKLKFLADHFCCAFLVYGSYACVVLGPACFTASMFCLLLTTPETVKYVGISLMSKQEQLLR